MPRFIVCFVVALAELPPSAFAADLTIEDADARLRRSYELARETNDSNTVDRVLELRDLVQRAFTRKDIAAAQRLVRDAEEVVGLDPGGRSMHGLAVARIDPDDRKALTALDERLAAAMNKEDASTIVDMISEMSKLLGDRAGLPDVRRKGETSRPMPTKPDAVADIFVRALAADARLVKAIASGIPALDTLPRTYASIADGCLAIRPLVKDADKLSTLNDLIKGCCKAMLALQVKAGHFKFPDLRGKSLLIGEAIEKIVDKDAESIVDGWLVVPFADGSSLVDASECGVALLRAGAAFKNNEWTNGGLNAAKWANSAPLVADFSLNASAVHLLMAAGQTTQERTFVDAARRKFAIGVAPGITSTGRLIDARSARTANHILFIRAMLDLIESLTPSKERDVLERSLRLAMQSMLDEADKLGAPATACTVQELDRYLRFIKAPDPRVRPLLEEAASAVLKKCMPGGRPRAVAPLPELAATARVWE